MEQDSHYFRVGVFVVGVFLAALIVIGWFASRHDESGHTAYAIYFPGAVDGLAKGAPIRLRGIQVGFVNDIGFVSQSDDTIRVIALLKNDAPVRSSTRATLQLQGITGSSFISLENLPGSSADAAVSGKDKDGYLIIPSRPSPLERVFTTVPEMIDEITKLAHQGQKVLSDDNANAIHETLASINASVQMLSGVLGAGKSGAASQSTFEQLNEMIAEAKGTLREVRMLAKTLRDDPSLLIHGVKREGVKVQ